MHDHQAEIAARVGRVLAERIIPAIHTSVTKLSVEAWHVRPDSAPSNPDPSKPDPSKPDPSNPQGGAGEPVPAAAALPGPDQRAEYRPFAVGEAWGPAWGTTWFHLTGSVPTGLAGRRLEIILELGWAQQSPGFQCEGLVYRPDGRVIKALNPLNSWIPVDQDVVDSGGDIDLYVEAAANPLILGVPPFRPTELGDRLTAPDRPLYRLDRADLNLFADEVWELSSDINVLDQLAGALADNDPRRAEIGLALDHALDQLDLADVPGTAGAARAVLAPILAKPAAASAHTITAIGHAHIDSAWLWPTRETVRKVTRTVANQLNLLRDHPDLVYAMSSAQQYAWVKERHPEVYRDLTEAVREGRFVPVGGMWVESDTNMVGSEAMTRQFSYGQRFFAAEFGRLCTEVWLPDSFGYSAALPQIVTLAGAKYFLTQKISWNRVNVFPHHTFAWEGIDGTRVFTHFPPIDTYNSDLSGRELGYASGNFRDKGAAAHSLAPFGWGDGGGGPTREMIGRARRTADLEGSPKVTMRSPAAFFAEAEAEYPHPVVWKGELYLELHRGTYTSQVKTKQGNRRSEHLLREAEQWSTAATFLAGADYPEEELDRLWKQVLLNQFHDILPGSSIAWVHREAREQYDAIIADLEQLIDRAQRALTTQFTVDDHDSADRDATAVTIFNGSPYPRSGIAALSAGPTEMSGSASSVSTVAPVQLTTDGGEIRVANELITLVVDDRGLIVSLVDKQTGREVIPAGQAGNLLQLHQDFPNAWDAWDIDQFYRNTVTDLTELESLDSERRADGAVEIRIDRRFGSSAVRQTMIIAPGVPGVELSTTVDWREQEKLLKLAFPADVHSERAAYETQYGHIHRPTHENTSWDSARFEVCAHRWVQVAETGFGVALVNDSTYGHDVSRHPVDGGGSYSVIRQSIIRGPRFPDPRTDLGEHTVRSRLVLSPDVGPAIEAGYDLNLPLRSQPGSAVVPALVELAEARGPGAVVVEAIKPADDDSGDLIVRVYEAHGGRAAVTVRCPQLAGGVSETDLLERPLAASTDRPTAIEVAGSGSATLSLRPFQIVTLRFAR